MPPFVGTLVIVVPVPLEPLDAVHENVVPATQEVSNIFTLVPLQTDSDVGFALTTGIGLMVTVFAVNPETIFPQASTIVGAGTLNAVTLPQVEGQLGIVNVNVADAILLHVEVL